MIMMDVSMYGQHSAPSYNSAEANYYNYSNSSVNSDHSMAPHHQYSGGSAGGYIGGAGYPAGTSYEDATYLYGVGGASTDSGVETPPSPQDLHFYPHQSNPADTSIISTETGLSYTNLDYANSNSSMYHQPGYSEESYPGRPQHDLLLRHHDDSSDANYPYLHDSKYHPLDDGSYHHHPHIVSPGQANVGCMEFQQLQTRYKEEMLGSDGRMGRHHGMHPMSGGQPQHPVLPTYKWMQVKRNIPKPSGQRIAKLWGKTQKS